ncbi:MAG: hypothetical protein V2I33_02275, partial [Kangiellaceae bacterium]|nr:hypothetical protein [Kangiellaceae bacterium]
FFGKRIVNPSEELDEETLTAVAELTGGRYFRARDEQELINIYRILDKLEPVEDEGEIYRPIIELYFYPIALALTLYFITYLGSTIFIYFFRNRMAA